MPDWNDYHAFQSTTDGSGDGCAVGCLPWIFAGIGILWVIGWLFG